MKAKDPNFEWKMPINFFGRVVDDANQPVADARVHFVWNDLSSSGTSEEWTSSAPDGLFSLKDKRGKGLTVTVTKDGYHVRGGKGGKSFEYAAFFEGNYHQPDSTHPVLFQLVKRLPPANLIRHRISEYLPQTAYDRQTFFFDLNTGSLNNRPTGTHLLVLVFFRENQPDSRSFGWSLDISAQEGEVQLRTDDVLYLAPDMGYLARWSQNEAASAQPFIRSIRRSFFLRFRDDHYGRVQVEVSHPNTRSAGPNVSIESFLNESVGSRNLEYDPSKEIKGR
jgi:hypothetical protein